MPTNTCKSYSFIILGHIRKASRCVLPFNGYCESQQCMKIKHCLFTEPRRRSWNIRFTHFYRWFLLLCLRIGIKKTTLLTFYHNYFIIVNWTRNTRSKKHFSNTYQLYIFRDLSVPVFDIFLHSRTCFEDVCETC